MMKPGQERIIMSANYYDNGIEFVHQPFNIKTGVVLCGMRHHNIIANFCILTGETIGDNCEQGFLTSKNRFVGRNEAANIARRANQIKWTDKSIDWKKVELYSEDIY